MTAIKPVIKLAPGQPFRRCNAGPHRSGLLPARPPDKFPVIGISQEGHWNPMAISEQQQAGMYVKVAAILMVVMLTYGALQLAGFMR